MRSASFASHRLALVAVCLLAEASGADAGPPPVLYPAPRTYYPSGYAPPGVYAYPQVVTTPQYYHPAYYSHGYPTGWYGGYQYTTGSFYYWSSPRGTSFYYTSPSFYYRYRVR